MVPASLCFLGSSLARARAGRTQATSPGLLGRLVGKVVGGGVQSTGIRFLLGERLRRQSVKGPYWAVPGFPQGTQTQVLGRTFNGIHRDWAGKSMLDAGYLENGGWAWGAEWTGTAKEEGSARVCSTQTPCPPNSFLWDTPLLALPAGTHLRSV